MKKLIDGKMYDTAKANVIYDYHSGYAQNDFKWCMEILYRTAKGQWYLYGEGGPMTRWAVPVGNNAFGYGEDIQALTPGEALEWLEDQHAIDEIQEYFPEYIKEA